MMNSQPKDFSNNAFEGESELRPLFKNTLPVAPSVDLGSLMSATDGKPSPRIRGEKVKSVGALTMGGLLACVAAVFAIVWLRPADTFAQVQEVVAATKSVRFTSRPVGERAKEDLRYAERIIAESKNRREKISEKLRSLTNASEREKLESELEQVKAGQNLAEAYLEKRGDNPPAARFFILGRYRQRQERSGIHGELIDITDMKTGKSLRLSPQEKTVTIFTKQTVISRDGKKTESEIKQAPDLTVDFYSRIRNVPETATKLSETKTIKGRKHIGFRVSKQEGPYTWTRTFWVDAETKLPGQIDISARSDDKYYGPSDAVVENIEFDVPLDEALFSTDTPAGYTVKKAGLMSLE